VIPISKISALSSGEFVGIVADDPHEKIRLKAFHAEIVIGRGELNREVAKYRSIPAVSAVSHEQVTDNYYQVKLDVKQLIEREGSKLKAEGCK
jgi:hypothetical protein